jgi:hypothetical protein
MFDARQWADEHGEEPMSRSQFEAEEAKAKEEREAQAEPEAKPSGVVHLGGDLWAVVGGPDTPMAVAPRDPEEILREQQVLWFAGYREVGVKPGGFYAALIDAAFRADADNLARIELGFPLVVLAVRRWTRGPLAGWYGIEL